MRYAESLTIALVLAAVAGTGRAAPPASNLDPSPNFTSIEVKDADVEAAVGLLCQARDLTRSKAGKVSGCRVCPEGTDYRGVGTSEWELRTATAGHFTAVDDDNLLLSGSGCDSHAMNFGGSFVFAKTAGGTRKIRYDKGLLTDQCHEFGYPDGRDFLVCRGGWGGQGENDENVFMAGFGASGKGIVRYLLSTTDTTGSCGEDGTVRVQESGITGIEFSPKDSRAITGLTITATLGNVSCGLAKRRTKADKTASPVKSYEIAFVFNGRGFQVTPESRAAYLRFEKK
jgi:hypothetical protein